MSKVIEKVIHNQTGAFPNSRNLLYNYQSGFCKNHSTDFCLSFLNDKVLKGFNQGLITAMTLINLLYNYQSGFSKNHSTDFYLSFLNNKILKSFD